MGLTSRIGEAEGTFLDSNGHMEIQRAGRQLIAEKVKPALVSALPRVEGIAFVTAMVLYVLWTYAFRQRLTANAINGYADFRRRWWWP
jgi:hypothetical protein